MNFDDIPLRDYVNMFHLLLVDGENPHPDPDYIVPMPTHYWIRTNAKLFQWNQFWHMPDMFVEEYPAAVREYFKQKVAAELMALVWHPRNIRRFAALGLDL